ncbi:hypothetical protein [Romboutsia sp.]
MWGAGRVEGHENLFNTIKSLQGKYEVEAESVKQLSNMLKELNK